MVPAKASMTIIIIIACVTVIFFKLLHLKYILAAAFIQSDFKCIQGLHLSVCVFLGDRTYELGVARTVLNQFRFPADNKMGEKDILSLH